ncbi:sarcosine reductase complex component B subunit alpha [Clostridioides difficile]|nr:sarcosine reductase complex component B subunit alpha [Clostridioides difficile]
MSKIRVVHYINNFFAGIGGEEKADIPPEKRAGVVGPGIAFQSQFNDDAEIISTVICGDTYFGENIESATQELLKMIKEESPDLFIAGPAFNAGRYGVACGTICKAVEEELNIPVVTGMYKENPGVDMFKLDLHIVSTGNSAASIRKVVPIMTKLGLKLVRGEEIGPPEEEGYIMRGIRKNFFHELRGSERAIDMLVKKMKGESFETEYPMPEFDRVTPMKPVKDLSKIKLALVTSGGIVPIDNPDKIESSSATKYGIYDLTDMDSMSNKEFTTIHGGYDRAYVLENPNLVVPLDVVRELEKEGVIGELVDYFITTTGTGTSVGNSKRFGEEFSKKLLEDDVDAVILTST